MATPGQKVANYEDAAKDRAGDTDSCRCVALAQVRFGRGRHRKRCTAAGAPRRTRAATARWICLGAGVLGVEWSFFPLDVRHLDSGTPWQALDRRPLGSDRKPVALRPGSLGAIIALDGKLFTVEPNHGQVLSVTTKGEIKQVIDISASEGHVVPTSIAERNGSFYVGNLNLFPINPQWARVLTISRPDFEDYDPAPRLPGRRAGPYRWAGPRRYVRSVTQALD